MNNKKRVLFAAIAIVLAVWGMHKYRNRSAVIQPAAVMVRASIVKETTLPQQVKAIGSLVARSIEVTPESPGHVKAILFKDGAYVTQGSILIQLDDAVDKAKFDSAEAQLSFAANNYNRMALLGKKGIVAQQAIDQANAELKEKISSAQEAEVLVNRMKLSAPFDGMVGKAKVNPGDYVTVGQSLVTLTDTLHLRVEYSVPENYLSSLQLGQDVEITSTAYPGKIFHGSLAFIAPTINTDNRSISLYADVPNENHLLMPGMFVNIVQSLGSNSHALVIPARSLVPVLDGEQVYKVVDGKAVTIPVKVGIRMADSVQIIQGLASGDTVVTDGQLKLRPGTPVKVEG